ncbi:MAG: hypothetical protein JRI23_18820 [Deltaproteobacteria bacterium]|jgi:type VI secretion system secreted protein VgrG|nr:hypothetical protein [Deltaproteobacteria bacterium]MBW2533917.1 hypothetical protein [Deltaproteobacteria bacterium]
MADVGRSYAPRLHGALLALCVGAALSISIASTSGCSPAQGAATATAPAGPFVSLRIYAEALPRSTRLVGMEATEAISEPYEVTVGLWIPDAAFDAARALRTRATVRIDHPRQATAVVFHGIWRSLEYLDERNGVSLYRGILVPGLHELGYGRRSRGFTDKTVPQIAREVLDEHGLGAHDYELRLRSAPPAVDHAVQYDQDDLSFLAQRLDRAGFYFYFEQGQHREKLVISDHLSPGQASPREPVPFSRADAHEAPAVMALDLFTRRDSSGPAAVRVQDRDYRHPTERLDATAAVAPGGAGTITTYGELLHTNESAETVAERKARKLAASRVVYRAEGRVLGLRAGHIFELRGHPRNQFDQPYLCTKAHHLALDPNADPRTRRLLGIDIDQDYQVSLEALPASAGSVPPSRPPEQRAPGVIVETTTVGH